MGTNNSAITRALLDVTAVYSDLSERLESHTPESSFLCQALVTELETSSHERATTHKEKQTIQREGDSAAHDRPAEDESNRAPPRINGHEEVENMAMTNRSFDVLPRLQLLHSTAQNVHLLCTLWELHREEFDIHLVDATCACCYSVLYFMSSVTRWLLKETNEVWERGVPDKDEMPALACNPHMMDALSQWSVAAVEGGSHVVTVMLSQIEACLDGSVTVREAREEDQGKAHRSFVAMRAALGDFLQLVTLIHQRSLRSTPLSHCGFVARPDNAKNENINNAQRICCVADLRAMRIDVWDSRGGCCPVVLHPSLLSWLASHTNERSDGDEGCAASRDPSSCPSVIACTQFAAVRREKTENVCARLARLCMALLSRSPSSS